MKACDRLTQERLSQRVVLLAELETTREQARLRTIPKGLADEVETDVDRRLNTLRGQPIKRLNDDPGLLLARVPLFAHLPPRLIRRVAEKCEAITLEKHEYLIRQDDQSNSLFMVSRGSLCLERHSDDKDYQLSTLIAGDSFGELALLDAGQTCRWWLKPPSGFTP